MYRSIVVLSNMTKQEDIWICCECGNPQGRHDMWFDGDICGECNEGDLFDSIDSLPESIQNILFAFWDKSTSGYKESNELIDTLESLGYTCSYGLDGEPIKLKLINKDENNRD
jgi:hypothetical protein